MLTGNKFNIYDQQIHNQYIQNISTSITIQSSNCLICFYILIEDCENIKGLVNNKKTNKSRQHHIQKGLDGPYNLYISIGYKAIQNLFSPFIHKYFLADTTKYSNPTE